MSELRELKHVTRPFLPAKLAVIRYREIYSRPTSESGQGRRGLGFKHILKEQEAKRRGRGKTMEKGNSRLKKI